MKTKILRLAVVLVGVILSGISVFADPLNNWHWRNPLPNGNPPPGAKNVNGIVYTNGLFFAVGANGIEVTSPDGTNWTQWATATTNDLYDIIYVNSRFMVTGNNGVVETSVNGTNWVLQNSGTLAALGSVAYGNGKYVAVGGSAMIVSSDGVTWTPATSGPGGAGQVAGGSSGFVAVNGGSQYFFSQNGLTWTTNTLTAPTNAFYSGSRLGAPLVTFANGAFVIAGGQYSSSEGADAFLFTSSDGQNWTSNRIQSIYTGPGGFNYFFIASGNGNVMVAGQAGAQPFIISSSNNVTWSFNNVSTSPYNHGNSLAYGNGLYVILNSTQLMYSSTDGVNWITDQFNPPSPIGPTSTFYSIAYSNGTYVVSSSSTFVSSTNGLVYTIESNTPSLNSVIAYSNSFVGVGPSGLIYQSSNGVSWTQRNSGTANSMNCVAAGNGLLVAVGNNGTVQTSPSGTIWTSRLSGTSLALNGVAYSNGVYVAVGQEGTVITSLDGTSWTVQDSGQLNNLLSVTYGSAGFLAVGASGTILTSPDGQNWTQQNSGTSTTLESVTFGNGYYLLAGIGALVMTSPDGVNWTSRNVGATAGPTLYGSGFLNGRFDVVGSGGTIIESDPVPPLFDLQMHATPFQNVFTIFATPGSSFRILSSTSVDATSWSTAATINNASAITLWTNSATGGDRCFFRLVSP